MRTLLSHCVSFTAALWTLSLHLHLHSKPHLHVLHYDSSSIAFLALGQFPVFGARSSTFCAVDVSVDVKLPLGAKVQLFKRDLYVSSGIWPFLYVLLSRLKSFKSVDTTCVIHLSFIVIRENFVCSVYFFVMFGSCLISRILIWV